MAHFQVTLEMLAIRGHTVQTIVKDEEISEITAFNKNGEPVIVIFQSVKFTVGNLKDILQKYNINLYSEFIIICKSIMMSNLKKVENISEKIEIFTECELAFNITKHSLVPIMEKLDFIIKDNWPIMFENDPMAKFMKFKHGDFIQVTQRDDPSSISYRLVKKIL